MAVLKYIIISLLFLLVYDLLPCVVTEEILPNVQYDLMDAKIWTCGKDSEEAVQQLEKDLSVAVLHRDVSNITFVVSNHKLIEKNLKGYACTYLGKSDNFSNFSEISQESHKHRRKRSLNLEWFNSYHNFSSIYSWFEELSLSYSDIVEFIPRIGHTSNNLDIFAIKITKKKLVKEKSKVYLQCLLHAREWITGPMCMYVAYRLATEDKTNSVVADILDKVEVLIVPVANPDGYQLTWTDYPKYRLWRKNLSKSSNSANVKGCLGVDLNRNFNIKWGTQGSSNDQCSETYCGSSAESELETKSISKFLLEQKPLIGALDIHSFSQAVLFPSAWSASSVENTEYFEYIAKSMVKSASQMGTHYTSQQMGSVYLASGTFVDWVYSKDFVENNMDLKGSKYQPLPFTIELPPVYKDVDGFIGLLGFMVKPDQILPICSTMYDSVLKYVTVLLNHKDTWLRQP